MEIEKAVEPAGSSSVKKVAARALRSVLSGIHSQKDIDDLVGVCLTLAVPYIRKRLNGDAVLQRTLDLDVRDFAYDCIADLFALAESGSFPHFQAYFAAYLTDTLSDEELLSHLRRLVFSQANQGIFRLYNEVDPSLSRILRNIKLALQQFDSLALIERFGQPCLAPSNADRRLGYRSIELEELEGGLRQYLKGTENVPMMLGKLALMLSNRDDIERVIPLTTVGIAFRSVYMRHLEQTSVVGLSDERIESEHLAEIVDESVRVTKERMIPRYVRKKEMRSDLLDIYFAVIEKKLKLSFSGDGEEKGLRELLSDRMAGMTDNEYVRRHRSRLEYLARLTGEEVARRLKAR